MNRITYLWIGSKMLGLFLKTLMAHNMYFAHSWEKIPQEVPKQLSLKLKIISGIFVTFSKSPWNFPHLEKKDRLDRLNSWEFIDSEKRAYLNGKKLMFQNTLPQSTCSRVPHTAKICAASVLSEISITLRQVE